MGKKINSSRQLSSKVKTLAAYFRVCVIMLTVFNGSFVIAQPDQKTHDKLLLTIIVVDVDEDRGTIIPNFEPDIDHLYLTNPANFDTIFCEYKFPFLILPNNCISDTSFLDMNFYCNFRNPKKNCRFFISIPLKFFIQLEEMKYVFIEKRKKNKLLIMQKWGNLFFIDKEKKYNNIF